MIAASDLCVPAKAPFTLDPTLPGEHIQGQPGATARCQMALIVLVAEMARQAPGGGDDRETAVPDIGYGGDWAERTNYFSIS
jgi:hypothetical protein